MNKRIRDLWDQAALKNAKLFVGSNSWETEVNFINTFAELIVKECAKVANNNYDKGRCPVGPFIIEHFGVE